MGSVREIALVALLLFAVTAAVAAQDVATGVRATYHLYQPALNNWELNAVGAYCSTWDATKPHLNEISSNISDYMQVTNTATGDEITVRIVDQCGNGGLDLDYDTAFSVIDTDRQGYENGHLIVDYEFVDCEDESSVQNVIQSN
ncbi:hypothetical protein PR202_gb13042 [Eleusine coracana subsp. coracana]|uniref:Barwin domain-containing protein n=1 Tax=Eleusine coracana subsp. coracana TaxID=191504 RepID=A0AAV5ES10_ELECO|nr:hypothetical protein PR202_gb13042 [Eleusine coracana subsp. coracana]